VTGERIERPLAAILAADVAGYSRLMGEDEEDTQGASPRADRSDGGNAPRADRQDHR